MNPLHIRVMIGMEDANLLEHIKRLERMESHGDGGAGISKNEQLLLLGCYERLNMITTPCSAARSTSY
jgi:hypothetical protein